MKPMGRGRRRVHLESTEVGEESGVKNEKGRKGAADKCFEQGPHAVY